MFNTAFPSVKFKRLFAWTGKMDVKGWIVHKLIKKFRFCGLKKLPKRRFSHLRQFWKFRSFLLTFKFFSVFLSIFQIQFSQFLSLNFDILEELIFSEQLKTNFHLTDYNSQNFLSDERIPTKNVVFNEKEREKQNSCTYDDVQKELFTTLTKNYYGK